MNIKNNSTGSLILLRTGCFLLLNFLLTRKQYNVIVVLFPRKQYDVIVVLK